MISAVSSVNCPTNQQTHPETMKTFILLNIFISCLLAESVIKQLTIQEDGMEYTQTVTLDFERNIQILEVPSHHNIIHSRTIFDFNNVWIRSSIFSNVYLKISWFRVSLLSPIPTQRSVICMSFPRILLPWKSFPKSLRLNW